MIKTSRYVLLSALVGFAVTGRLTHSLFAANSPESGEKLFAREPLEVQKARADYLKAPTEARRQSYVGLLLDLAQKYDGRSAEWKAIDQEVNRNPVPKDSDSNALAMLRVGQWITGRHEYVYRKDGTWTMLPIEPGATHGRWKIVGNQ